MKQFGEELFAAVVMAILIGSPLAYYFLFVMKP